MESLWYAEQELEDQEEENLETKRTWTRNSTRRLYFLVQTIYVGRHTI
jgi:hypothetical protein